MRNKDLTRIRTRNTYKYFGRKLSDRVGVIVSPPGLIIPLYKVYLC
jgi:hypothetical protein